MNDHEELANDVNGVIELTDSELSSNGYMKPIEKLKGKNTTCRAVAYVRYNDKHYSYSVQLTNCDEDYPTNSSSEELVKESNIVSDGAGLYYDSEYDEYYFRGEYINNYVSINGDIWRVLKVDRDRNIKLIENATELRSSWDNRYNSVMIGKTGINIFEGVANSRIKDALLNEYNTNPFYTDAVKSIIIPTSYCYGARSITNNEKNEEEECKYKTEIMPLAALSVADFYRVSLDYNCNKFTSSSCSNYNYLSKLEMTWTMTAVGENSYEYPSDKLL